MAVINLNRETFVQVCQAEKCLLTVRTGLVQLADSASPADQDWIHLQTGDMMVVEVAKYARAHGTDAVMIRSNV